MRAGALVLFLYLALWCGPAEGGFCVRPPAGALSYCQFVNYKVYVISADISDQYWTERDRNAEIVTEDWARIDGCNPSISVADGWCKNYACALAFPRCNSFDDAPLGVCRQTCIDCFDTCTPDRPILAPSLFYGSEAKTWEQAYTQTAYDAFTKAYRCEADHRLINGMTVGLLFYGTECTSGQGRSPPPTWLVCALLTLVALFQRY
mmetsp:Transcript_28339/g.70174  ORF Transcript_28339/g.70174 Transcript_28339/m.70174 type:complete len:206 (+) Transcript_28339:45-662(+)